MMEKSISLRVLAAILAAVLLIVAIPFMPITAEAVGTGEVYTTQTINLFNSGRTGDGYSYAGGYSYVHTYYPNYDDSSFTNGGYDIYSNGTECTTSRLGESFVVENPVVEAARLTISAFDVDESSGERDYISLVDATTGTVTQLSGYLSGVDQEWNNTAFTIAPENFTVGHEYYFQVYTTDATRPGTGWHTFVRTVSVELTTLGESGEIVGPQILNHNFSASISGGVVYTQLYLQTSESVSYSLEYAATIGGDQRGSANSTINVTSDGAYQDISFYLESGSSSGTYEINVFVKDMSGNTVVTYTTTAGYNYKSVSYNSNGGTTNVPLDMNAYSQGSLVDVLFNYTPYKAGHAFIGWSTTQSAVSPEFVDGGASFTVYSAGDGEFVITDSFGNYGTVLANLDYENGTLLFTDESGRSYVYNYASDNYITVTDMNGNYAIADVTDVVCTAGIPTEISYTVRPAFTVGSSDVTLYAVWKEVVGGGDHEYEYVSTTPPTCIAPGEDVYYCVDCEDYFYAYIPANGHRYQTELTRSANCDEYGILTHTCVTCGDSYVTYVYAAHNYIQSEYAEPTCTEDGGYVYTCTECGDSYVEVIPGTHDYIANITKLATPTEYGEITYTCSRCGDSYVELTPPRPEANVLLVQDRLPWTENINQIMLNRLLEEGYITGWDATTTAAFASVDLTEYQLIYIANDQTTATYDQLATFNDAITSYVAAGGSVIYGACDHGWAAGNISYNLPGGVSKNNYYSYYNYIVNPNHPVVTGVLTDGKAITNEILYSTYSSHTYFNKETLPEGAIEILSDANGKATLVEYSIGLGRVIASGLTWEYTYVRDMVNGTSFAQNVYDDLIVYAINSVSAGACEHMYLETETLPPTCTEQGYTVYTCEKCGGVLKDNYVAPTGHTESEWTVYQESGETENGLEIVYCTECEEILKSRVLPKLIGPVSKIEAQSESVIIGQTLVFTVSIENCEELKSLAVIPEWDVEIFELVSIEWCIDATIQSVDEDTLRAVSVWESYTDVNGIVLTFTLKANRITSSAFVGAQVMKIEEEQPIDIDVIAKEIAVTPCPHTDNEYTEFDGDVHIKSCTYCGFTEMAEHVYDNACDEICNCCDAQRIPPHDFNEVSYSGADGHQHICVGCGIESERLDHVYDDDWDGECNGCGYVRYIIGDVDNDGDVDSDDSVYLAYYHFFGQSEYSVIQPIDYDSNGFEDSDDAVYLLYYVFFGEAEYPLHP